MPDEDNLELHFVGCKAAYKKLREKHLNSADFAKANGIDILDAFWFFKGCPVQAEAFRNICKKLDLDWQEIHEKSKEQVRE